MSGFGFPTEGAGAGTGDVQGPVSSTDNAIVRFDGTGGKDIKDSGILIDDSDNLTVPGKVTITDNSTATDSTIGMNIDQAGTGDARLLFSVVAQDWVMGIDNGSADRFRIQPASALSSSGGVIIDTAGNFGVNQGNPTARCDIRVDDTDNVIGLTITQNDVTNNLNAGRFVGSYDSASDIFAVSITADNAGAGVPGGIDMSSFSVDEPLIQAVADAITTAGTVSHQIAMDIGGTVFYLVAHTHGS